MEVVLSIDNKEQTVMPDFLDCPHRNVQTFTEFCLDCGWNIWTTDKQYYEEMARRNRAERIRKNNEIYEKANK